MTTWHPTSWQNKVSTQQVQYPSNAALTAALNKLGQLPPLVTRLEIDALKSQLADAALGNRFILQGGDCAESFTECDSNKITDKLRILLQMSLVLIHGMRKPIIRIGRVAGQYAKPRSTDTETQNGITLPSYRGDLINGSEFTEAARLPNPERLLQGYYHAASTLNYLRALVNSGFADLHHANYWDLDFAKSASHVHEYQRIVSSIQDTLQFIQTVGGESDTLKRVDFYTSHEALHLLFEQALTRQENGSWYNFSTHFPWLGMRTADLNAAHIEYFRGIANPIAVKIGPKATTEWIQNLVKTLNPQNEPGRLTLITRLGASHIAQLLPPLINAVQTTGINVLWSCDPMHGNTVTTAEGYKTRKFDDVLMELSQAFSVHKQHNSTLGGVHFELTGENVTECIGGARGLTENDLRNAYKTLVDPRLNYEQSIEMALLLARNAQ